MVLFIQSDLGLGTMWEQIPKLQGNQGWFLLGALFLVVTFFAVYKWLSLGTERQASADKKRDDLVGVLNTDIADRDRQIEELKAFREKMDESPEVLRARAAAIERKDGISPAIVSEGRLLLVDDSEDLRNLLALWLRMFGYDVETAESGTDALSKCLKARSSQPFEIILLDEQMPGMNGQEFVRKLRSEEDGTRVVFFTADPNNIDLAEMARLDVLDVWRKPISRQTLQKNLHKILN